MNRPYCSKETILRVRDVTVNFTSLNHKIEAVKQASFDLYKGESLAIVGESGCGKSALVKSILGLNPKESTLIESGKILYEGSDLLSLPEKKLRSYRGKEIGMIFQDPMASLNPTMKIGNQISESCWLFNPKKSRKQIYEQVISLLHLVEIPDPEKRYHLYPFELSGGMRQRVMIAIALAASPKILIADEATTALDATIQAQILHQLSKIQKKLQMSIVFITHNLALVAGFCSRIIVMYGGRIIESASTDTLFKDPKHPYTQKLLASIPRIDQKKQEKLASIEGHPPSPLEKISGCPFHPRCSFATEECTKTAPVLEAFGKTQVACYHPKSRTPTSETCSSERKKHE